MPVDQGALLLVRVQFPSKARHTGPAVPPGRASRMDAADLDDERWRVEIAGDDHPMDDRLMPAEVISFP